MKERSAQVSLLQSLLRDLGLERRQKELDVASQLAALHETRRTPDSRGTLQSNTGNSGNTGNTDREVQAGRGVCAFPVVEERRVESGTPGTDPHELADREPEPPDREGEILEPGGDPTSRGRSR